MIEITFSRSSRDGKSRNEVALFEIPDVRHVTLRATWSCKHRFVMPKNLTTFSSSVKSGIVALAKARINEIELWIRFVHQNVLFRINKWLKLGSIRNNFCHRDRSGNQTAWEGSLQRREPSINGSIILIKNIPLDGETNPAVPTTGWSVRAQIAYVTAIVCKHIDISLTEV